MVEQETLDSWRRKIAKSLLTVVTDVPIGTHCAVTGIALPSDAASLIAHFTSESFYRKVKASPQDSQSQVLKPGVRFDFLTGERTDVEILTPTVEYQPHSEEKPPDLYLCAIGCGYLGSYDDCLAHEQVCKFRSMNGGAGGSWFTCEYDCGFVGAYDVVVSHEKNCLRRLGDAKLYICAFQGCNYQNSYAEVEKHEATCKFNPNPTNAGPEGPPPSGAPASAVETKGKAAAKKLPFTVETAYPFTREVFPSGDDEEILFFQAGKRVSVIDVDDEGDWWFGQLMDSDKGVQGWFPTEYVTVVS
jgi:hypothetical protein